MLKKTILAALILTAGAALAGPQLAIPEVEFIFGKVPQHSSISHRFLIKSVGDDTLRITKVVPGCGCTQAPLEDTVLAPGDSTWLEIVFSSRTFRGSVAKRPYMTTNVGDDNYYVRIDSDILTDAEQAFPLRFNPYKLDVSQFGSKLRRSAQFTLENVSDTDYTFTVLDTTGREFDVEMPTKVKVGEKITGKVTVHENAIESDFEQSFTIELNDKAKTRYTLPVRRMYREREPSSFGSSGK